MTSNTAKQKFYDYYHKKNNRFYKIINKNNFTYYEILQFFHNEILNKLPTLSKMKSLDIGCGVGTMALYFASLGMNIDGIDVSARAIKIARDAQQQLGFKNIKFSKKMLQNSNKKYNFVLTSEVIEHIENEKEFLNKINNQLRNNGLLYLTTPLKENYLYKLGFYKKFDKQVGHLRRYTTKNILNLLQKNGFTILKYKKVEGPLRNLLFTTSLGFLIKFIRGPLIPTFHFFDRVSIYLFGASDILILAKKNN